MEHDYIRTSGSDGQRWKEGSLSRTEITKQALGNALNDLLQHLDLDQITIQLITEKCGISRNAFYYHFKDKYDLINWVFLSETLPVINTFSAPDKFFDGFVNLCKKMTDNRQFYTKVLLYNGQNSIRSELVDIYDELIRMHIEIAYSQIGYKLDEDELYILSRLEAHAYVGVILDWVENGMQENYIQYFQKLKVLKNILNTPLNFSSQFFFIPDSNAQDSNQPGSKQEALESKRDLSDPDPLKKRQSSKARAQGKICSSLGQDHKCAEKLKQKPKEDKAYE